MLNTILIALTLIVMLLVLYKLRKVHLMQYEISNTISHQVDNALKQIEALHSLYLDLGLDEALPITRGWAASPDFLLLLKDITLNNEPNIVVECSSGVSTIIIAKCLQIIGSGHVYSLEHDSEYAEKTSNSLQHHGLHEWATVVYAPLTSHVIQDHSWDWYDIADALKDLGAIDMLVVDGPPATVNPQARYPALPLLKDKLSDNAKIILDDANRPGEKAIIKKWKDDEKKLSEKIGNCEKGCSILTFNRNAS